MVKTRENRKNTTKEINTDSNYRNMKRNNKTKLESETFQRTQLGKNLSKHRCAIGKRNLDNSNSASEPGATGGEFNISLQSNIVGVEGVSIYKVQVS